MLTGNAIKEAVKQGHIYISDFDESRLNPNSYNLRLSDKIAWYNQGEILDSKTVNLPDHKDIIGENGFVLRPGFIYLASTMEVTHTNMYVPCISGRSSTARLGIEVHRTAGFGDIGFKGTWTLEITVMNPVIVYAGMEIAQIYYEKPDGAIDTLYHGKYLNQIDPTISHMYEDFHKKTK